MRVAVHHPDGSVSAFRLGRITDEVCVNHVTGETSEPHELAYQLQIKAQQEHPDCKVVIERLVDNNDGTSTWVHEDEVPEGSAGPGGNALHVAPELTADQPQEVSS